MMILSGYSVNSDAKSTWCDFPKKEIDVHLKSFLPTPQKQVFYTNNKDYTFDGVDVRQINFETKGTHGFILKHQLLEQFFSEYPEENDVLYVDYDTFLNGDIVEEEIITDRGFSISICYGGKMRLQGGVFYVNREYFYKTHRTFIQYMIDYDNNPENTFVSDEPLLAHFLVFEHDVSFGTLQSKYNYCMHKFKHRTKYNEECPVILHFHVNTDRAYRKAYPFMSENLKTLIQDEYFGK